MPLPNRLNSVLTGEFKHGLIGSMCAYPGECCFFTFCAPCAIWQQRKRIMHVAGEPYLCCAGLCCFRTACCPKCCLYIETLACPCLAHASNRFLVQTRFNKKNSTLENILRPFNCFIDVINCTTSLYCWMAYPSSLCPYATDHPDAKLCSTETAQLCKATCCIPVCTHCQNVEAISEAEEAVFKGPPRAIVDAIPEHFSRVESNLAKAPAQEPLLQ